MLRPIIIQCTKSFSHFWRNQSWRKRENICSRESKPSTTLLFSNSLVASSSSAPHGVSNLRKCFSLKFSTHAPICLTPLLTSERSFHFVPPKGKKRGAFHTLHQNGWAHRSWMADRQSHLVEFKRNTVFQKFIQTFIKDYFTIWNSLIKINFMPD